MHTLLIFVFSVVLGIVPMPLWADSGPAPSRPTLESPFDEDDPAFMQAEVGRQVLTFLQSVQSRLGQSQETLRRSIAGAIERDERGTLVYARRLSEHAVLEGYNFLDGGLVRGQYLCLQRPVNGLNEFIDYYAAVKQFLTASYGTPAQDHLVWDNDLYQPLPDYWGVAVQIGHLSYAARWETPEGTISIELTGNHHGRLMVEYQQRRPGRPT